MKLGTSLEELKKTVSLCLRCGMCTYGEWPDCYSICPIYIRHRVYTASAGGLIYLLRAISEGRIGYTATMTELAYQCTLCGACDICQIIPVPPPHVRPSEIIRFLRNQLVLHDMMPEKVKELLEQIHEENCHFFVKADLRIPEKLKDDNADTVLFIGDVNSNSERGTYEAAIRLIEKAGKTVAVFNGGNFWYELYDLGFWDELNKLLSSNSKKMKNLEGKEVLFINPHLQEFITKIYPEIMSEQLKITGRHFSQFLVEIFKDGRLKTKNRENIKVCYHDPCHLSRGLGIHEAPRELLSFLGVELIEMAANRENTYCCGAGGKYPAFQNFSNGVARERIKQFEETDAQLLITACSCCRDMFHKALPLDKRYQVQDLIEFVDKAIE